MTDIAEATMLYRKPTNDSDEAQISEVWGKRVETKVVDASEVEDHAVDGWVTNPAHIDNPPKSEPKAPVNDQRIAELESKIAELEKALENAAEVNTKLESDLKAATELADAESKAKDEALTKLEAAANAKPAGTLGIKGK